MHLGLNHCRVLLSALALLVGACAERQAPLAPTSAARSTSGSPTLLECPGTESLSVLGTIDPLGGLLEVVDAAGAVYRVEFPAGAVEATTLFQLDVPVSPHLEVEVSAVDLVTGELLSISFPVTAQPTLSVGYARCGNESLSAQDLRLYHIDPASAVVLEGPFGSNDGAAGAVSGAVPHFSEYAIGTP